MKNCLISVECAIEHDGKLLIIKRPAGKLGQGLLSFPGGGVEEYDDHGDMLRSAAKREVFEEVGLKIEDPLEYITSNYFINGNGSHVIHTLFYCVLKKTNPKIIASKSEVPEYFWMTQEEINSAQNAPAWLKNYVNRINNLDPRSSLG
ncbi:MAG: NUDIX hydrolase [bacterium]